MLTFMFLKVLINNTKPNSEDVCTLNVDVTTYRPDPKIMNVRMYLPDPSGNRIDRKVPEGGNGKRMTMTTKQTNR